MFRSSPAKCPRNRLPQIPAFRFGLLAALAFLTCRLLPAQMMPDTAAPGIIDAHTHTDFGGGREGKSGIPLTRDEYFREWREAGITGAVAHTHESESDYVDLADQNVICCAGIGNNLNTGRTIGRAIPYSFHESAGMSPTATSSHIGSIL